MSRCVALAAGAAAAALYVAPAFTAPAATENPVSASLRGQGRAATQGASTGVTGTTVAAAGVLALGAAAARGRQQKVARAGVLSKDDQGRFRFDAPEVPITPSEQPGVTRPLGFFDPLGFSKSGLMTFPGDSTGFKHLRAADRFISTRVCSSALGAVGSACPEFGCAPPDGGWYNKKRCLLRMMEPEAAFSVLAPEDEEVLDLLSRVNDSKQLTEQQRESLFEELTDAKFQGRTAWSIAECSVDEIDAGNILQASLQAMSRAVHGLTVRPGTVLVDGCNRPPELLGPGEKWTRESQRDLESRKNQTKLAQWFKKPSRVKVEEAEPWRPKEVEAVIEGDGRVPSISAASVLAKVSRDRQMDRLDALHPLYGFKAHKGYGTEAHLKAIRQHGICSEHRKTFGPIREAIEREKVTVSGEAVSDNKRSLTADALQGSRKSRKATA
eukprot:s371_g13.t2